MNQINRRNHFKWNHKSKQNEKTKPTKRNELRIKKLNDCVCCVTCYYNGVSVCVLFVLKCFYHMLPYLVCKELDLEYEFTTDYF